MSVCTKDKVKNEYKRICLHDICIPADASHKINLQLSSLLDVISIHKACIFCALAWNN